MTYQIFPVGTRFYIYQRKGVNPWERISNKDLSFPYNTRRSAEEDLDNFLRGLPKCS